MRESHKEIFGLDSEKKLFKAIIIREMIVEIINNQLKAFDSLVTVL